MECTSPGDAWKDVRLSHDESDIGISIRGALPVLDPVTCEHGGGLSLFALDRYFCRTRYRHLSCWHEIQHDIKCPQEKFRRSLDQEYPFRSTHTWCQSMVADNQGRHPARKSWLDSGLKLKRDLSGVGDWSEMTGHLCYTISRKAVGCKPPALVK